MQHPRTCGHTVEIANPIPPHHLQPPSNQCHDSLSSHQYLRHPSWSPEHYPRLSTGPTARIPIPRSATSGLLQIFFLWFSFFLSIDSFVSSICIHRRPPGSSSYLFPSRQRLDRLLRTRLYSYSCITQNLRTPAPPRFHPLHLIIRLMMIDYSPSEQESNTSSCRFLYNVYALVSCSVV